MGVLWENFIISERVKANLYAGKHPAYYFWRTTQQQEIDWLEEESGQLKAFEFKWNPKATVRFPNSFREGYPQAEMAIISLANYMAWLLSN